MAPVATVPARRHRAERPQARGPVAADGVGQGRHVHGPVPVHRHGPDAPVAQAEQVGGLALGGVGLVAHVHDQATGRLAREPAGPVVPPVLDRRPVAGRGQRGERGRGTAADQHPVTREAGELGHPADRAPLEVDGGVVTTGAAGVHRRRHQLTEDTRQRRAGVGPPEEPRVAVAEGVGQDVGTGEGQQLVDGDGAGGQRLVGQPGAHLGGDGPPHRPGGQPGEVVGDEVDGGVAVAAELVWRHVTAPPETRTMP